MTCKLCVTKTNKRELAVGWGGQSKNYEMKDVCFKIVVKPQQI